MALGLGSWGKTATSAKLLLREFPGHTDAIGTHELRMYEYLHAQSGAEPTRNTPGDSSTTLADWGVAPVPLVSRAAAERAAKAAADGHDVLVHVAR